MPPLVIAHRGASAEAPENTLVAFNRAFELGADGIELDVQVTQDGVPVILHPSTVDYPTHHIQSIAAMTLAEVKRLDVGAWFDEKFRGEPLRIPTLEQVLEAVGARGKIIIELKRAANEWQDDGRERAVARIIRQATNAHDLVVSSFHPVSLYHAMKLLPDIPRALIYHADIFPWLLHGFWFRQLVQPQELHINETMATERYVRWAQRRGYRVIVYHPDEPAAMQRIAALGVDGIMTNKPALLRRIVDEI